MNSIIQEKIYIDYNHLSNQDYQPPEYLISEDSNYIRINETIPFLKFLENLKKDLENEYFNKEKQLKRIENHLFSLASKYDNVVEMRAVNDPQEQVSRIFFLKISENMSSKERRNLESEIIENCLDYSEDNNILEVFMDTALILER